VIRLATPLKAWAQRFAFILFTGAAFGLMLMGKADTVLVERARMALADAITPILGAISQPVDTVRDTVAEVENLAVLRAENAQLKAERQRLAAWQTVARKLEAENEALRQLLHMVPDPDTRYVTARVVGDRGGAFVHSVLVAAGQREGVAKGHAALSGEGLAGRVAEVGRRSARILLLTDLNSRVPVVVAESRYRGVLAGDNSPQPSLFYLPPDAIVEPGQRIVTSGHGGVFPPGLPVGRISTVGENGVRVEPFVDWDRMEFLRLVNYGMPGVLDVDAAAVERRISEAGDPPLLEDAGGLIEKEAAAEQRVPRDPLEAAQPVVAQPESTQDVVIAPPPLPRRKLEP
jgi:rod shape-determining protein MreC